MLAALFPLPVPPRAQQAPHCSWHVCTVPAPCPCSRPKWGHMGASPGGSAAHASNRSQPNVNALLEQLLSGSSLLQGAAEANEEDIWPWQRADIPASAIPPPGLSSPLAAPSQGPPPSPFPLWAPSASLSSLPQPSVPAVLPTQPLPPSHSQQDDQQEPAGGQTSAAEPGPTHWAQHAQRATLAPSTRGYDMRLTARLSSCASVNELRLTLGLPIHPPPWPAPPYEPNPDPHVSSSPLRSVVVGAGPPTTQGRAASPLPKAVQGQAPGWQFSGMHLSALLVRCMALLKGTSFRPPSLPHSPPGAATRTLLAQQLAQLVEEVVCIWPQAVLGPPRAAATSLWAASQARLHLPQGVAAALLSRVTWGCTSGQVLWVKPRTGAAHTAVGGEIEEGGTLDVASVSNALWAAGRLCRAELSAQLPLMAPALADALPFMSQAQLVACVWGLACTRGSLSPLLSEALTEELWVRRPATFSPRDLITLVTAFAAWQQPLQPPQHAQHAQLGGGVQKLALPIGLQQAFGERLWAPQVVSPGGVGRAAQVARSVLTLLDTCTQGEGQLSDAMLRQLLKLVRAGVKGLQPHDVTHGLQVMARLAALSRPTSLAGRRQWAEQQAQRSRQEAQRWARQAQRCPPNSHPRSAAEEEVQLPTPQLLRQVVSWLVAKLQSYLSSPPLSPSHASASGQLLSAAGLAAALRALCELHVVLSPQLAAQLEGHIRLMAQQQGPLEADELALLLRSSYTLQLHLSPATATALAQRMVVAGASLPRPLLPHRLAFPLPHVPPPPLPPSPGRPPQASPPSSLQPSHTAVPLTPPQPPLPPTGQMPEAVLWQVVSLGRVVQGLGRYRAHPPASWSKALVAHLAPILPSLAAAGAAQRFDEAGVYVRHLRQLHRACLHLLWGMPRLGHSWPPLMAAALLQGCLAEPPLLPSQPCPPPTLILTPLQLVKLVQGVAASRVRPTALWVPLLLPRMQSLFALQALGPTHASAALLALAAALRQKQAHTGSPLEPFRAPHQGVSARSLPRGPSISIPYGPQAISSPAAVQFRLRAGQFRLRTGQSSVHAPGGMEGIRHQLKQLPGGKRLLRSLPGATRRLLRECTTLGQLAGLLEAMLALGQLPGQLWVRCLGYAAREQLAALQPEQGQGQGQEQHQGQGQAQYRGQGTAGGMQARGAGSAGGSHMPQLDVQLAGVHCLARALYSLQAAAGLQLRQQGKGTASSFTSAGYGPSAQPPLTALVEATSVLTSAQGTPPVQPSSTALITTFLTCGLVASQLRADLSRLDPEVGQEQEPGAGRPGGVQEQGVGMEGGQEQWGNGGRRSLQSGEDGVRSALHALRAVRVGRSAALAWRRASSFHRQAVANRWERNEPEAQLEGGHTSVSLLNNFESWTV